MNKNFPPLTPTFLRPLGSPYPPTLTRVGKPWAAALPFLIEAGPDATQQESWTAARMGCAHKLYLVNSVCFCFIFTFHSIGRGMFSNALKGIWDCDPNMLGSARVNSGSHLSSALAVWTRQAADLTDLPNGGWNPDSHPNLGWTLILCLVVSYPLLRFRWGFCCFSTAKLRGSVVNSQIA